LILAGYFFEKAAEISIPAAFLFGNLVEKFWAWV
jgi:hypothetical protein